jgi:glycosyltransferase involved in cell wall biosynthesis
LRRSRFAPDLVVTFGDPMSDHLLGLRLAVKLALPWVAHFSDPWSDNPFRRRDLLANFVNRHCERRVIAAADRLIFTSRETVDLVMRKYPRAWREKCAVIPHSFDPTLYPPRSESDPALVVRHLGHFYGHRTPLPLFRALRLILRDQPDALRDVRFDLIGRVPTWVKRHGAFRSLPEKLVQLLPAVSYSESVRLMANSDLLLVIDGPADLSVFLPSKLIEYIGAGVPIYGIVPPGTSANLLQRLGGRTANPRNVEHVAEALLSSLRSARDQRASAAHRPWGDPEVRAEFVAARVAQDFNAILAGVVS